MDKPLFGPFSRKGSYSRVEVIDSVFADRRFTTLFQEAIHPTEIDDLTLYRRYLKKGERVLFYGALDAEAFNTLCGEGYDLYMVESETELCANVDPRFRNRIYGFSMDVVDCFGEHAFESLVLPGTKISCYSRGELLLFLRRVGQLLTTEGTILCHIWNASHVRRVAHNVGSRRIDGCTVFYGSQVSGDQLILNLYLKDRNREKVGYAVQHLYEANALIDLARLCSHAGRTLYTGDTVTVLEFQRIS
ncbi:hypothetical protein [Exiguobacterium flavidum]|uniref:hypothetical protein n=1 Tax=Exiguobacterium flavidum TaxID=2184695 RepID=UPI000DF814FA|nr:hypothetical protein [Exiguobacterium flavidum]